MNSRRKPARQLTGLSTVQSLTLQTYDDRKVVFSSGHQLVLILAPSSEIKENPNRILLARGLALWLKRALTLGYTSERSSFTVKTHRRIRLLVSLFLGVAACTTGSPALSLVGPATEDQSFAAHVVMVLKGGVGQAAFCTGVVLAPRVVLTAAHCTAAIGDMRIYYRDGSGASQFFEVAAVAIHPRFRADALTKRAVSIDLALIQMRAPLGARFSPAQLDETGAVTVGEGLRIVGYGLGREGEGATGGVLRSALLRVRAPLSTILLWAEDPNRAGAGACSGDSGGPILSDDGAKVLAITTWSAGAGVGKRCGAVTQGPLVAPQRAWIDDVIKRWRP
jgi:hypothetical protein